jgi:putative oxidoreductase
MNDFLTKLQPLSQNAMRIMIGFAFWTHGGQKLFAWFGREETVALMSRFGVAGIIEFFGGLLIIFGLFTRPVAFIISGQMAVAYWLQHVGGSGEIFHWANGGELALVYCFVFLFMAAWGGGDFSVDGILKNRRQSAS